jgi:hypothetical protein
VLRSQGSEGHHYFPVVSFSFVADGERYSGEWTGPAFGHEQDVRDFMHQNTPIGAKLKCRQPMYPIPPRESMALAAAWEPIAMAGIEDANAGAIRQITVCAECYCFAMVDLSSECRRRPC